MIVKWTSCKFEARCRRFGVEPGIAEQCVTKRNDDGTLLADNRHPSYPRPTAVAFQRAASFAASAFRHAANGAKQCTQEQIDARYAICKACPLLVGDRCTKCGCGITPNLSIFSKLSWASERCPIGKWEAV